MGCRGVGNNPPCSTAQGRPWRKLGVPGSRPPLTVLHLKSPLALCHPVTPSSVASSPGRSTSLHLYP